MRGVQRFLPLHLPRPLHPLRCRMLVQSLRLDATPLAPGILRLRLTDPVEPRWEVPQWLFDSQLLPGSGAGRRSTDGDDSSGGAAQNPPPLLELDVQQDPFSMVVTRGASDGAGGRRVQHHRAAAGVQGESDRVSGGVRPGG